MKIAVLGTGMVGHAIAKGLLASGHHVRMGSRSAANEKALEFAGSHENAGGGTFADAAAFGELAFNCTAGAHTRAALELAGAERLAGKVLIDVANPLDFSAGMPPGLTVCNDDSLGEQVQRWLPQTHVVKALNTMNCDIMVNPASVPGDHVVFICGNSAQAKTVASRLLVDDFGWRPSQCIDLGGIEQARGTEMFLPLWLRIYGAVGHVNFNIALPGAHS
ncbi:MAG: NAD(P)-binding domain-containing protein [Myxococcota bacterium]